MTIRPITGFRPVLKRMIESASSAEETAQQIAELADELDRLLPNDRYIRHSQADLTAKVIQKTPRDHWQQIHHHIDGATLARLQRIDELETLATDRAKREEANGALVDDEVPSILTATQDLLPDGLTEEQARAFATDEDVTLVLAGAGAGKTAVIIGKISHLVRNQGVAPESILALAFNRKAAIEIRERLPADLKGAHVSTFHSFALRVIAAARVAPTISKMAQDDFAYVRAIEGMIRRMLTDPQLSDAVLNLLSTMTAEYRAPFDFNSPAEYQQYVRDSELRTLNLDLAKSFEELAIANFLSQQGIAFQYEKPYEFETATSERRQYTPDFYLPDHDIYIEHFALNQHGRPPRGWTGYMEGMSWKRRQHAERRTSLIETYSWQHRDETLLDALERQLLEAGVEFDPVPVEELVERISRERISWLAHLLGTFLNHAKSGNLAQEEIERRAKEQRDQRRTRHFLDVFHRVRQEYEALLQEERAIDFHDLINQATEHIRQGNWASPFDHVLIDEFQDISDGRMALAKALGRPAQAYFLVGDDWQSIYRFAGSHVGLIHQCDEHLGYTRRRDLTRTFRFGDGILEPSTAFVQRNPEQTQRALLAHLQDGDEHHRDRQPGRRGRSEPGARPDPRDRGRRELLGTRPGTVCSEPKSPGRTLGQPGRQRGVQHRPQRQGPGGRLRRRPGPSGRPVRLSLPGRGRPAAGDRIAADPWAGIPVRRGAPAVLRGADPRPSGKLPDRGPQPTVALREGVAQTLSGNQAARRTAAPVSGLSARDAAALAERRQPQVFQPPQLSTPRSPVCGLSGRLRRCAARRRRRRVHKPRLPVAAPALPAVPVGHSGAALGNLPVLGLHRVLECALMHVYGSPPRPA